MISTHAPLARCDLVDYAQLLTTRISTHAPLARCDVEVFREHCMLCNISTHAPLARCDWMPAWLRA